MKKGLKKLVVGVISIFGFATIVYALPPVAHYFNFSSVGQYIDFQNTLSSGTHKVRASLYNNGPDATLGLSLSKSTILGWSFISRCNLSVNGKQQVDCNWTGQSSGLRKGTIVLDSKAPGVGAFDGYGQLGLSTDY